MEGIGHSNGILNLSPESYAKLQRKNKKNTAFSQSSKNSYSSSSGYSSNSSDSRSRDNFKRKNQFKNRNQENFNKQNKNHQNPNVNYQHLNSLSPKRKPQVAKLIKNFESGYTDNFSEADKEKINWLFAGPVNTPEAKDLPLPDLSWINHFKIHGKQVLSAR